MLWLTVLLEGEPPVPPSDLWKTATHFAEELNRIKSAQFPQGVEYVFLEGGKVSNLNILFKLFTEK